ncbi:MAG: hypothetical protein H7Z40_04510 [Phycisphaerae bacterium]|nr:hypothetical protein [Gemmatimonadaceae bacterium]
MAHPLPDPRPLVRPDSRTHAGLGGVNSGYGRVAAAPEAIGARATAIEERLVLAAVSLGMLLRVWQWVGQSSLYWGELALARNIDARGLLQLLTERTAFGQGSALGYLAAQKTIVSIFGSNELTHRLFPFAASVLALWLFTRLAQLYLSGGARVFAVASFALGFPFVLITAPFKPLCTVDTAATLVLFLLAHDLLTQPATRTRVLRAGALGFAVMWFAEPTSVLAVGLIVVMSAIAVRAQNWRQLGSWAPAFAAWMAGAVAAPWISYRMTDAPRRAILRDLYDGGALPPWPQVWTQANWLWDRAYDALGPDMFHYRMRSVYIVLIIIGVWPLLRRNLSGGVLLLAPIAGALVASGFGLYIFQGFYLAFLFPYIFVLIALGIDVLRRQLDRIARPIGYTWMAGWTMLPVVAIAGYLPPYRVEEIKPVLQYVRDQWREGDAVYGFFAAGHGLAYYGPQLGFSSTDIVVGACHHGEAREYFKELDTFRGRARVWAVFAHDLSRYQARAEVLNYLDQIGTVRDSVISVSPALPRFVVGAQAYLYDLSDSTRLAAMNAQTMPLLRAIKPGGGVRCSGLESAERP